MLPFLTSLGSMPAGPGNFRFLFVRFVHPVAALDSDMAAGNTGLMQGVVAELQMSTSRPVASIFSHLPAHLQFYSQINHTTIIIQA